MTPDQLIVNSDEFRTNFWHYLRTLPIPVKRNLIRELFIGTRTILEDEELHEWGPVNNSMLEKLLFSDRNNHNFTGNEEFIVVNVIRKPRCDGCGEKNNGNHFNNLPFYTQRCNICDEYIEHKYPQLNNDDFHNIIYNFDNWCRDCCVQPLFDIHYMDDYSNCVRCAMIEIGYNYKFVHKLCDKYYLASIYAKHGIEYINKLINNKTLKL